MNYKPLDWTKVLVILLFVLVVYMILTRLFGHSATDLAITLGLFTLLFVNQYQLNREVGEIKSALKYDFIKVKEDIQKVNKGITLINTKLKIQ